MDSKPVDHVYDWVWQMRSLDGIIPPFCVEINLTDGNSYYMHSVPETDEESKSLVLRVWDFRTFDQDDIEDLKQRLNEIGTRVDLDTAEKIHPKLDWADIRMHLGNVNYAIEWNDQLWPREERPQFGLIPNEAVA